MRLEWCPLNHSIVYFVSILGMPTEYINAIIDKIDASYNGHHYLVDCATRKNLPNIEYHFGDAKVVLTRDDYSWKYFVSVVLLAYCKPPFFANSFSIFFVLLQSECQVGLNERPGSDDFLIGTLFFTKATFEQSNRLGRNNEEAWYCIEC